MPKATFTITPFGIVYCYWYKTLVVSVARSSLFAAMACFEQGQQTPLERFASNINQDQWQKNAPTSTSNATSQYYVFDFFLRNLETPGTSIFAEANPARTALCGTSISSPLNREFSDLWFDDSTFQATSC